MSRSTRLGFGFGRHAAEAELEGDRAEIHAGALGHAGVFSMLDDAEAYARGRGKDFAHDAVFEDGVAIVGDGYCAGGLEGRVVVEDFALGAASGRADGKDAHGCAALGRLHPAGDFRRVVDGGGVGHGGHGGKSARGSSGGAGGDGFLVGLAGLAQVDVNVDEAGRDGEAGGIEDFSAVGQLELAGSSDLGNAAVLEQNVFCGVDAGGGIDEVAVTNGDSAVMRGLLAGPR